MRLVSRFFYFRQNCWLKKLGSILLLGLMLQYSFGLHILYAWNSFTIRQLMKSAIASGTFHHNQIVTLHISTQQSGEAVNDYLEDEIVLDGKMYDVVSARKENSHIVIQAICDEDETRLTNTYQQVIEGKKQSLPDKDIACLKAFFSPFLISAYPSFSHPAVQNVKSRLLYDSTAVPLSLTGKVLKPPPRCA